MTPVVSAGWLASHRGEVKVVDGRWYVDGRSGLDAYHAGHLPGAVWVDLDRDLSGPAGGAGVGRHPLPDPADFAAALGRLGVGEGQPVVVYDDAGGSIAARLWWMLHVLGEPVAVLDGGLPAWPGPLETGRGYAVAPVTRTVRPWPPGRFVDVDHVLDAGQVLVDARAAARYAGGDPRYDPRPGHIPGARNRPWSGNLGEDGRFLGAEELRTRFGDLDSDRVVAYCGSGVTACHDLLALELAGLGGGRLFVGSWSAWAADLDRPTEP